MSSEHIQNGALRKYLLRALSAKDAEAVEERYFTDSSFFKQMRTAEIDLICDYLDDRLSQDEREQFESHYLRVPLLHKLVEDVRTRRSKLRRPAQRRALTVALAGAMVCVAILGIAIFRHYHTTTTSTPIQTASVPPRAGITLLLSPGVTKGPGSTNPTLNLLESPQPVFLVAELPGQVSSAAYTARLLNIDLEGNRKQVWIATGLQSTPQTGEQQVVVELPSTSLLPGDYILEVGSKGGHQETYLFRVNPPENERSNKKMKK